MDKVLIFGSSGQLGTDLVGAMQNSTAFDVIPLTHEMADCRDADAVRCAVLKVRPKYVVNCAAYVNVDECEDHAENAFAVNALGALNIARACAEVDACCVYVSTDYVFAGHKNTPYIESDSTNPINIYGTSKLAGEHLVKLTTARWLIVRVASLFGKSGAHAKGGNFIERILAKAKQGEEFEVVADMQISPTYTRNAAGVIAFLMLAGAGGVIHVTNRGSCSWYDFAKAALELCGIETNIIPVPSSVFPMRARRPINSVLRSERSDLQARCPIPTWREALCSYLVERGYMQSRHTAILK